MALYAQVLDNIVQNVCVVNDDAAPDEAAGKRLMSESGLIGLWVLTTADENGFRGKPAAQGDIWDGTNFIAPEPIEETP